MSNYARREHPVMLYASWAALVGSFVLSAATWIVIGDVAGFNIVVGTYTLYFAIGLPFVVDAYIVCALVAWMHPTSERVERFAKWNAYGSAAVGWLAQAVYHGASIWATTHTPWKAALGFVVGGLPPAAAFLGVHLRAMSKRDLMSEEVAPAIPVHQAPVGTERPAVSAVESQISQLASQPVPQAEASRNSVLKFAELSHLPDRPLTPTPNMPQPEASRKPPLKSPSPSVMSPNRFSAEDEALLRAGRLAQYRARNGCSLRTAQRHAAALKNGKEVHA